MLLLTIFESSFRYIPATNGLISKKFFGQTIVFSF
jgi:hypothetical protein